MKPRIGDRVTSLDTARTRTGYNGTAWHPGLMGELIAYPPTVRAVPCPLCHKRHQTYALVEYHGLHTCRATGPEYVHDRVALPICDIRRV